MNLIFFLLVIFFIIYFKLDCAVCNLQNLYLQPMIIYGISTTIWYFAVTKMLSFSFLNTFSFMQILIVLWVHVVKIFQSFQFWKLVFCEKMKCYYSFKMAFGKFLKFILNRFCQNSLNKNNYLKKNHSIQMRFWLSYVVPL